MQNVLELGVESLHAFISVQRNVRCMLLEVSSQNRRERAFVEYKENAASAGCVIV